MKTLAEVEMQTVQRKLLERDVQQKCVDWARARGYWARKFSSMTQRSVPDYLFASGIHHAPPYRTKFACEFKAPGKTSTEAQVEEQQAMRRAGWYVFECDNFEKFKYEVDLIEQEVAAVGYC